MDEEKQPLDDRLRQVETTKRIYGEDHYRRIGQLGGRNSPTKFDSGSASAAVKRRWDNYRKTKEEQNGQS